MARERWRRGSARRPPTVGRRTGTADEVPWWDPDDQAWAEAPRLHQRQLGRGWIPAPMVNNEEAVEPLAAGPAADPVLAARRERRPTALDEGRAWRHRELGALAVLRVERYASADDGAHRLAWQAHGAAALGATWRARWTERDVVPGWIEARAIPTGERPEPLHAFDRAVPAPGSATAAVDWFRVEDHTDPSGSGDVTCYEHLTVWGGRSQVTLTLRHALGTDVAATAAAAAAHLHERLRGDASR